MSHSFAASRHVTPRSSYCRKAKTMSNNKTNQSRTSHVLKCCIISKTVHLAVPAAQPVAAHSIMGEGTLLTAVGSAACTFLAFKVKWHSSSIKNSQILYLKIFVTVKTIHLIYMTPASHPCYNEDEKASTKIFLHQQML